MSMRRNQEDQDRLIYQAYMREKWRRTLQGLWIIPAILLFCGAASALCWLASVI